MSKSHYSKETTLMVNEDEILKGVSPPPDDVVLDPIDVQFHNTLLIPIRALEFTLLDYLLELKNTNNQILARNTKGTSIPKLVARRNKLEEAIKTVKSSINLLNDSLDYKITLKLIEGS